MKSDDHVHRVEGRIRYWDALIILHRLPVSISHSFFTTPPHFSWSRTPFFFFSFSVFHLFLVDSVRAFHGLFFLTPHFTASDHLNRSPFNLPRGAITLPGSSSDRILPTNLKNSIGFSGVTYTERGISSGGGSKPSRRSGKLVGKVASCSERICDRWGRGLLDGHL